MGTPNLCRFGVFPFLGGCGAFTGSCRSGGRYSGLWAVSFVSPHLWVRVRCRRIIRCVMCRLLRGRWRRSSPAVIWLRGLVVLTVRLSVLSSKLWGGQPVTDLDAGQVAAVFEELWAGRAPATWNTRRTAVRAFASWCGGPVAFSRGSAGRRRATSTADGQHPGHPGGGPRGPVAPPDGVFAGENVVADAV